jgi:hypothetical protein
MKSDSPSILLALPPALLAEVEAAADEEHRPVSDVLRDLVEYGLGERRWKAHAEKERRRCLAAGLPDDALLLTDGYRQILREKIAEGVRSLRDGNLVDGESFMAEMDAELATLERQGH